MSWFATQAFRSLPQDTATHWLSRERLATYFDFSLPLLESMSDCVVVERGVSIWQIPITSPSSICTGPAMHSGHLILSVSAQN